MQIAHLVDESPEVRLTWSSNPAGKWLDLITDINGVNIVMIQ